MTSRGNLDFVALKYVVFILERAMGTTQAANE
jgi:hypothetical protein